MEGLIGKKIGMTSVFDEQGRNVPCTVIEVGPCVVTQVKTVESDGYNALQLGYGSAREKSTSQALKNHLKKAGAKPVKKIVEFRDTIMDKSLGDKISVQDIFTEGDKVNVSGKSKGKGFQGVVKRHGFAGVGQQTHGQHNRGRAPGSIGAASYPAKVMKGMKMGGRTGGKSVKMRHLKVVKVLPEQNLLVVKGAVPGHKGALVVIEKTLIL